MRRTLRIFPLYYAVLLGALLTTPHLPLALESLPGCSGSAISATTPGLSSFTARCCPSGAIDHLRAQPIPPRTLTLYLGHFWSLCVEEQFYLVWPMVVFTLRKRETLRNLCLASVPVLLAARLACLYFVPQALSLGRASLSLHSPARRCSPDRRFRRPRHPRPGGRPGHRLARTVLVASIVSFFVWELA